MRNVLIFCMVVLCFLLFSCKVTKVQVGNYSSIEGKSIVYDKGKDIYLLWELFQIRSVENQIKIADYEKIVKRSIFDNVVYYGTMGIFSFHTVKIMAKHSIHEKENKTSENGKRKRQQRRINN